MLAGICAERGWVFAHAVQPAAQDWLGPEHRGVFDAVLCYDLPGLVLKRGTAPRPVPPASLVARRLCDLFEAGQGFVFLHHALAGWPAWPGWAEVLGGRYHYTPASLRGAARPDSGFRYARYTVRVVQADHPVCAGVGGGAGRALPLHAGVAARGGLARLGVPVRAVHRAGCSGGSSGVRGGGRRCWAGATTTRRRRCAGRPGPTRGSGTRGTPCGLFRRIIRCARGWVSLSWTTSCTAVRFSTPTSCRCCGRTLWMRRFGRRTAKCWGLWGPGRLGSTHRPAT